MSMRKSQKWKVMGFSLLFTVAIYALFLITFPVYFYSDNWEVAVVTAGYYGSNSCQYLHPLLCVIIKWVGFVLPTADVFTLLVHLALAAGFTLTTYLAVENFCGKQSHNVSDWLFLGNVLLAELFLSEGLRIWSANYNIQTGAILFFGILVLFVSLHQHRSARWIIAATTLILFGLMLRVAVTYLFIPYFVLLVLGEILTASAETRKLVIRYILPVVCLALVLMLSRTVFLSMEPYHSAETYNRYRTIAVDYPMKDWSVLENPDFSQTEYEAATNWFFIDTEKLNTDTFRKIAETGSKNEYDAANIHGVLGAMWRRVQSIDIYMFLLFLLTIVLAVKNLISGRSGWRRLETILAVVGSFIILYYFTVRGRAPIRVWQPVLFATDAVLITVALEEKTRKAMSSVFSLLLIALLWYGAGQVIAHGEFVSPQNILTARVDIDDSIYAKTYDGDGIYIWPNWHATIPKYFIEIGKLPTQRVMDHNIAAGDWTYDQVYYREYLDRLGIPNPAEALMERDNTFLMSGNKNALDYLKEHYGDDLEMEQVGEINGTRAYRVFRNDNSSSTEEDRTNE